MSIIIIILLVLAGLIAIFLLVALFTKKDFRIEKEIVISQPKEKVFNFVKLIKNQEYYSVWVMKDPQIKMTYTGTDGTPGFIAAWESNDKNVGIGEQEIKKINEGESIEMELRFKKPFEGTNQAITSFTSIGETQTKVSNVFTGASKFPMNIMNLFMDKLVGGDMQKNLQHLKTLLEKE